MDAQDFRMPSPKRQRTESPMSTFEANPLPSAPAHPPQPQTATSQEAGVKPLANEPPNPTEIPGLGLLDTQLEPQPAEAHVAPKSNDFLDALMLHVESLSQPEAEGVIPAHIPEAPKRLSTGQQNNHQTIGEQETKGESAQAAEEPAAAEQSIQLPHQQQLVQDSLAQTSVDADSGASVSAPERFGNVADGVPLDQDMMMTDEQHAECGLTSTKSAEQIDLAQNPVDFNAGGSVQAPQHSANVANSVMLVQDKMMTEEQQAEGGLISNEGAEWEADSSPYVSSDSDDSSDTTSEDSDDEDVDGDYAMLDPEEQARILMAGDGGSDDEGDKKGKTAAGGHLRTTNEKVEEVIPKPDIVVTEEMDIEELGKVEGVVEKTVLVKATISGEYQVLESNSLLCLQDRSVVGVVAEPLGRVEQPMYTIRFTNDEAIKEAGLSERGTKVFYVPQHSTFVFTQPLKAVKGSDASNFHDEEVGDDEMEFSDDEAEAEHKKLLKMKRHGRRDEQGGSRGRGRGGRGNYIRGGRQDFRTFPGDGSSVYRNDPTEISYDDVPEAADEGYTPLARPANLNELMAGVEREPLEGSHHAGGYSNRGYDADSSRGRGRGRGRGDRDRRGGRGGRGGGGSQPSWTSYQSSSDPQSDGYSHLSPQSMLPPPLPYQQQPNQPRLSPQTQQTPFSPSPISPLSGNNFNFNFQPQNQQWPGAQSYQQQHGQAAPSGYHARPSHETQQYGQNQQQGQFNTNGWNANQAAAAQVAAQLEQLKRSLGQ